MYIYIHIIYVQNKQWINYIELLVAKVVVAVVLVIVIVAALVAFVNLKK